MSTRQIFLRAHTHFWIRRWTDEDRRSVVWTKSATPLRDDAQRSQGINVTFREDDTEVQRDRLAVCARLPAPDLSHSPWLCNPPECRTHRAAPSSVGPEAKDSRVSPAPRRPAYSVPTSSSRPPPSPASLSPSPLALRWPPPPALSPSRPHPAHRAPAPAPALTPRKRAPSTSPSLSSSASPSSPPLVPEARENHPPRLPISPRPRVPPPAARLRQFRACAYRAPASPAPKPKPQLDGMWAGRQWTRGGSVPVFRRRESWRTPRVNARVRMRGCMRTPGTDVGAWTRARRRLGRTGAATRPHRCPAASGRRWANAMSGRAGVCGCRASRWRGDTSLGATQDLDANRARTRVRSFASPTRRTAYPTIGDVSGDGDQADLGSAGDGRGPSLELGVCPPFARPPPVVPPMRPSFQALTPRYG
ncbi:hypothetical protein B0H15DRAFT_1021046 [Mycena belliarum]|uniref:Uncharacterized protein n=1 Tax=Mycena belliarum TaxID=1033014 RepID=A0AAD6XNY3_9AGAR|nr:hypothetical protein B0H15DRAFT_1021046 [Mycena belliae]